MLKLVDCHICAGHGRSDCNKLANFLRPLKAAAGLAN
jgi:hypothetical protein